MLTPQVQAISRAKRDSLTMKQKVAIRSVIASDPDEEDPWGPDDDDYCQGKSCVLGGGAEEGYCLGDQFPEYYYQTSPRAKRLMHK